MNDPSHHSNLGQYLSDWSTDLALLWQNNLLTESSFIRFARDRSLAVAGVVSGHPGYFHKKGWLTADRKDSTGNPLFHPFRFYVVYKILDRCKIRISPSDPLNRDSVLALVQNFLKSLPRDDDFAQFIQKTTKIVDLAVLLEPAYWPGVTSWLSRRLMSDDEFVTEENFDARLAQYRTKVNDLVAKLDPKFWSEQHKVMRRDAVVLDENTNLYVLLRLTHWKQRKELKGTLSGALWLRHMAEVIRRAFEQTQGVHWPEEDEAYGTWVPGGRKLVFGFDRPLDNISDAKPYVTASWGLHTGSALRWYVEGKTEYYANLEILVDPATFGIEMLNLRGNIVAESDNIALKLTDLLEEDKAQKRFSFVSFDTDVVANVRTIRRQVKKGRIVGFIAANTPDFEFANFALVELVEVAATLDEHNGQLGSVIRKATWDTVSNMGQFEDRYKSVSLRSPASLKGEEWGRALAQYAIKSPIRSDTGAHRLFLVAIEKAIRARSAIYDVELDSWEFDPATFRPTPRTSEASNHSA
jgi:hypothetical protein